MPTLDHLTDPMRVEFVKLASQYEVPDFVLAATEEQLQSPEGPANRSYALPMKKALPLHTKVAAWLSAAYLQESTEYSDWERKVATRTLNEAINIYGIEWPKKKAQAVEPQPAAEDYLIEVDTPSGKLRRLPVRGPDEVKVAMAYLKEHRLEFPWEIRQQASQKLLTKIASYGVGISEDDSHLFNSDAANFVAEPDQLSELLKTRSLVAKHLGLEGQSELLMKLSKEVAAPNGVVVEGSLAGEILSAVEVFDRSIGRKSAAVDHIPVVTNDQFTKWAENVCVLKSGHVYDKQKFAKLPLAELAAATGKEEKAYADELGLWVDVNKTAAVLEDLSEAAALRAVKVCTKAGVESSAYIEKEARLTSEELQVLANG